MNEKFSGEKYAVIHSLEKAGLDERQAGIVADCLVTADEWGVTSHGVRILPSHLDRLCRGAYNPKPTFRILKEFPAFAVVDGDNSFGPVSAAFCMDMAIKKAKEMGVFQVFSRNKIGRAHV